MAMTNYHLCLDVRGALQNWTERQMRGVFLHDDGRPMSTWEAKNMLMDEIAKGHKVIPTCECDNFSYETGCQGHPVHGDPAPEQESDMERDLRRPMLRPVDGRDRR